MGRLDAAARERVHFAQIQGMADPLTAGLAAEGFSSLKLLVCRALGDRLGCSEVLSERFGALFSIHLETVDVHPAVALRSSA